MSTHSFDGDDAHKILVQFCPQKENFCAKGQIDFFFKNKTEPTAKVSHKPMQAFKSGLNKFYKLPLPYSNWGGWRVMPSI